MASTDETSPVTCSICLENKHKKAPRILPCLHSFCQECLEDWHTNSPDGLVAKSRIKCPLCRKEATVPVKGICGFPLDFKVQEYAIYIEIKNVDLSCCQACKHTGISRAAFAYCKTCSMRFCKVCSNEHTKLPLFSRHEMTEAFCKEHGALLKYVCVDCSAGVCVHCIYSNTHREHAILDDEEGISETKTKLENMKSVLNKSISVCSNDLKRKSQLCADKQCVSEERIRSTGERMKGTIDKLVRDIIKLHRKQHKVAVQEIFGSFENKLALNGSVVQEIDNLFEKDRSGFLKNVKDITESTERSADFLRSLNMSHPEPALLSADCCRLEGVDDVMEALSKCKLACGISAGLSKVCARTIPVLRRTVECGLSNGLESPWNVSIKTNGDAVVCNLLGGPAVVVNKEGAVEALQECDDASASYVRDYDVYLLYADGKKVIKISDQGDTETILLMPPVPNATGLAIDDGHMYVCSQDKVMRYSLSDHSGKTIMQSDSSAYNNLITVSECDSPLLFLTDLNANAVIVCDLEGKEIRRLGTETSKDNLDRPAGIARISNGNCLIADWGNSRIVEYEPDGTFVGNLLTCDQGIDFPTDIAFLYPYLWVTEYAVVGKRSARYVKMFMYPS